MLALTFVGGVTAIRGIVWFALACMVFLPVAIGRKLESKSPGEPRRGLNLAIATGLVGRAPRRRRLTVRPRASPGSRSYWPREAVEAVRAELGPEDRVFAPDRFSDWMLFKIPELRGRMAYDVRFELYDDDFFDRLQDYGYEDRARLEVVRGRLPHRHRRREAPLAHRGLPRRARMHVRSTATTTSR